MTLEALANELLLELFKFLEAVDLFRAFHGLNSRFNSLLVTQFRAYHLNFHSVLKYQLDFLPLYYLPLIANKTLSLRLSDKYDESPSQSEFFFSSDLQLNQFVHLRSLSLFYINDEGTLRKLMVDCHQLPYLTHLKVFECPKVPKWHKVYMNSVDFSNIIWSLPKLTYCCLQMEGSFCVPTVVSLSLEYLSISCRFCWLTQTAELFRCLSQIAELFQQTPHLYRLHMPLNNRDYNPTIALIPSILSITMLKLFHVRSFHVMNSILLIMPNLTHLKVDTQYNICDGYRWEEIIDKHLPKLEIFHLRMHIDFGGKDYNERHVDNLVDSFSTRFWIEKRQWYIRCHQNCQDDSKSILLYTLPYAFSDFNLKILTMAYKSTCPQDNSYIQFSNIRNLCIELPFDKSSCQIIPTLHRLNSLTVLSTAKKDVQFDLQSLLDRSPCLYSLKIESWLHSQMPVVQNTSASVRRLDIRRVSDYGLGPSMFYSREECNTFIHSPLAMQCEELLIKIASRESILDLVNNMVNLRILFIEYLLFCPKPVLAVCQYDKVNRVFIKWLRDQLPATCILSNSRYISNISQLWIYLKKP